MPWIRRRLAGQVALVLIAVACVFSFSFDATGAPRESSSAAVQDSVARGGADTAAAIRADTSAAGRGAPAARGAGASAASSSDTAAAERAAPWTMDELKAVLGSETKVVGEGKEYRERKSGRVAMACALVFPGLGQAYNEKPLKAAIAAGAEWFYVNQIILNRRYREREKDIRDRYPVDSYQWQLHDQMVEEYWERSVDWIWWTGATLVVIIIDAYVDAHLDDMRFKVEVGGREDGAAVGLVFRY